MTCSKQQPTHHTYVKETALVIHVLLTQNKSVFGQETALKTGSKNNDMFKGNKAFSTGRDGGESLSHWPKIYSSFLHQEQSPSTLTSKFLFFSLKAYPSSLENAHVKTSFLQTSFLMNPIKTSFLAVVIAPTPLLSYLHTLCTRRSC